MKPEKYNLSILKYIRSMHFIFPVILLLASGCCTGGWSYFEVNNLEYPVSLSSSVFDAKGRVHTPEAEDIVKEFTYSWSEWRMLWCAIPLSDTENDITEQLRDLIKANSGDAIVKMKITVSHDWQNIFAMLIPVIPSSITVKLSGYVVKK